MVARAWLLDFWHHGKSRVFLIGSNQDIFFIDYGILFQLLFFDENPDYNGQIIKLYFSIADLWQEMYIKKKVSFSTFTYILDGENEALVATVIKKFILFLKYFA